MEAKGEAINYNSLTQWPLKGAYYHVSSRLKLFYKRPETGFFNSLFAIYVAGQHVADLATDGRGFGAENLIHLSFKNELFYTEPGWYSHLEVICGELNIAPKYISRLDIALDVIGKDLLKKLSKIYRYSTEIEHNENARYKPLSSRINWNYINKQHVFGKPSKDKDKEKIANGKQVVVYNKTREIEEKSGKDYITRYHAENGLYGAIVERVEVRLTADWLGPHQVFPQQLLQQQQLINLFVKAVAQVFEFKDLNTLVKDRYRHKQYKQIEVLKLDFLNAGIVPLKPQYVADNAAKNADRTAVKALVEKWLEDGNMAYLKALQEYVTTQPAPRGKRWSELIERYAKHSRTGLTDEQIERQNSIIQAVFLRFTIHSNHVGLQTA